MANLAEAKKFCLEKGCPEEEFNKVAALPGISFSNLLALIEEYGPGILTLVLSLFNQSPLPSPLPAPTPAPSK